MNSPHSWNQARADHVVRFVRLLRHAKGRQFAGRPFLLLEWQERLLRELFGRVRPDGRRRYRTAYVEVPRKNGKTELAAAIALYMLIADGELGAEVYSAAADREQAGLVFQRAAAMIRQSKTLSRRLRIIESQKRVVDYKTGSFYHALSAEAYSKHGYSAHAVIYDELHAAPTRELWDVLSSSMGAREQPLMMAITTAGYDRQSICWELHEYADRVQKGLVDDPTFLPVIYAAAEGDDWEDERVWAKANPSLDHIVSRDYLRSEAQRAREMPSAQNAFRRLYLDQWTQQADRWIDLALWDQNAGLVVEADLVGRECYGGLDLGMTSDFCAWVLAFPGDEPDEVILLPRFWIPETELDRPSNRYAEQYRAWRAQGLLTTTPGETVDYAFTKAQILRDAQRFKLREFNVDRLFQGHQLMIELAEEGLQPVPMGQGFYSMASPTAEFARRLRARKIRHGGHPVLRWMADSVAVRQDPAGNLKPDKARSQGKIDGIVAAIMALDRLMRHESHASVYETRGLVVL